jgi:L-amino acid N-acyltransferase YncA
MPDIRPVTDRDWPAVTAIFNHYVAHSPAAYPERPVGPDFFRERLAAVPTYPFLVGEAGGEVVGFAYLAPFLPLPNMRRTGVLTYFLHPDHTGRGLGGRLLEELLEAGRAMGVRTFLAHIHARNEGSIRFHLARGFVECGRFSRVGEKNGEPIDMVWVQRVED